MVVIRMLLLLALLEVLAWPLAFSPPWWMAQIVIGIGYIWGFIKARSFLDSDVHQRGGRDRGLGPPAEQTTPSLPSRRKAA